MRLEWVAPALGFKETEYGYDVTGIGLDGTVVPSSKMPMDVEVPVLLCWRLEPDDDLGTIVTFIYEVHGPNGIAGREILEADHPPFFANTDSGLAYIYRPMGIAFTVAAEGNYLAMFGETSDLGATVTARYGLPLVVSHTQPDRSVR